jgi:hypothetical protein
MLVGIHSIRALIWQNLRQKWHTGKPFFSAIAAFGGITCRLRVGRAGRGTRAMA